MLDFCIIGSGISGSTIASNLKKKYSIKVFDKARGIGGRSSFKRYKKKVGFDHGLQYLSPRSKEFKSFTNKLIKKRVLKHWKGKHEFLNRRVKRDKKHVKLIGVRGNNDISKFLLKNINCNFQSELSQIKRQKNCWYLKFKDNNQIYSKKLIITAPYPQAKKLTSKFIKGKIFKNKVKMNSCLTVLLITNKTNSKMSSFFTNDKVLGWVSNENSKKRFNYNKDLWVLQSTFEYGKQHTDFYKNKKKFYTNILINKFKKITNVKIKKIYFSYIHGWKYSSNSKPLKTQSYWNRKIGLGLCGDWFGGPRFEDGWLSARDLYKKITL
tara:strand:+ start:535 stop:1506 length:972 start_codon:yes stop_codon:yes gene_type:complete